MLCVAEMDSMPARGLDAKPEKETSWQSNLRLRPRPQARSAAGS